MAANRTNSLVLMWRLHDYLCYSYTITPSTSTFDAMQCNMHAASVKMILVAVIPTRSPGGEEW